ncbi:hypothetical protein GCM10010293_60850 [Streptomyces griseoflavus]|uniref:hypothetical protein n=1 Tax=Streptomyces griseoflavus TaxID=35619 RepID=UPI00167DD3CE|nr:hypothetical protein [Streptomyces griseoflavus]GGV50025.1 hypothetical protein GCM10010293_60850 [Streptomyces griseoflavus]
MGMKSKIVLGAVVGVVVIGAVSANSGDADGGSAGKGSSVSAQQQPGGADPGSGADAKPADGKTGDKSGAGKAAEKASQDEQFKAFVRKNGTPQEKEAVAHVTKVQGAEEQNDILDAADVYTDFTGGIMGQGTGPAKLIASAFADWKQSENGLVTVYDAEGELLGNGTF